MNRLLVALLFAVPLCGTSDKGGIMLGGGSTDVDDAFRWMCAKAGGGDFLIIRASGTNAYDPYIRGLCPSLQSVQTLIVTSREQAQQPAVKDAIMNASAIFIAGGDQGSYVRFYSDTPVVTAINAQAARGVTIGGTSAGTAVLAQFGYSALTGSVKSSEALANPYTPLITVSNGFLNVSPLLRNTFTDDHFHERDRMGRLIAFLARVIQDGGATVMSAIAVDEKTAYLMEPDGTGKVAGSGSVYFLKTTEPPGICKPGTPLTFRNISVSRRRAAGPEINYRISAIEGVLHSTQPGGAIY